jgi:hypothetical protein
MIVNITIFYVDNQQHILVYCVLMIANITILYVDDHQHIL